ncbi:hypothetical protein GIB67_004839, partial [Kingdonia uniflora]
MHLPIIYESFKDVPNDRIALVVMGLEECYDISHVAWFDLKEKKIRDAWKRCKCHLNTTLIVGNNPGDVKASSAPEFVPREDWVKFVDYCNSEKFLAYVYVICTYPCAKSKRNKENRSRLIASCTLGRTSMPIIRHKLAEERGVTDEEIGRVEVYIPAHTKKDKTIQCPDVIKFGKERKCGTQGMGVGMSISLVEKVGHIVNENEELRSTNNELKFATEKLKKDLDALVKYIGNIPVISPTDSLPSNRLVGCPWSIVAHGVILGVDPTDMYHSVALGNDFYKVAIHDIVDGNALLFRRKSNIKRLLDMQDNYGASGYFLKIGETNKRKHVLLTAIPPVQRECANAKSTKMIGFTSSAISVLNGTKFYVSEADNSSLIHMDVDQSLLPAPAPVKAAIFESFARKNVIEFETDVKLGIQMFIKSKYGFPSDSCTEFIYGDSPLALFNKLVLCCIQEGGTLCFVTGTNGNYVAVAKFLKENVVNIPTNISTGFMLTVDPL